MRRPLDRARLERIGRELLEAIGEDPDREGLRDTPARWARWWVEFIDYHPGQMATGFGSTDTDQIVVVSGMRVWSLCEHHLLPFWADIAVGYRPGRRILGLSKFARIAHRRAHALQVQERLVRQIADDVEAATQSPDVAILATGQHLCMAARGIKTNALMTTSVMRGLFRTDSRARAEFLALCRAPTPPP